MPSITEQSAWAEASHVISLISGSDYFRIKAEFMNKSALSQRPGLIFWGSISALFSYLGNLAYIYIYTYIWSPPPRTTQSMKTL